jgi:DNA invertase Pin-like site-specific DNA recombinase
MATHRQKIKAIAYLRTSSAANVGTDKDSDKRQRAAIEAFAKANGYALDGEPVYDAAVSGTDHVIERKGFKQMLDRIEGNGVRCIIIESPDRFARDLAVQLAGHAFLKSRGIALIPTTAPDYFTEDTPTAVLVRQVLGAIAQFEKASLVARLKLARDRTGKYGRPKRHSELRPDAVVLAKQLKRGRMSLRQISSELAKHGHLSKTGKPFTARSVASMLRRCPNDRSAQTSTTL